MASRWTAWVAAWSAGWICTAAVAQGIITLPATSARPAQTCALFPSVAVFNQKVDDVARFPTHASSNNWVNIAGKQRRFHADWGTSEDPALKQNGYWGIPISVVDGTSKQMRWTPVSYDLANGEGSGVPDESDCAVPDSKSPGGMRIKRGCFTVPITERLFPIPTPTHLKIEGGHCNDPKTCGDRHLLVVDTSTCRLWESFSAYKVGEQWNVWSSAAWDLYSLEIRPLNWTSVDAAGLPVAPLLLRAEEASRDAIQHALRVTFRDSALNKTFDWPATHAAGNRSPGAIPFGARMRMRADFQPPSHWTPQSKAIVKAMKSYGLFVADIGTDFFVQGEPSAKWDPATIEQLQMLRLEQFEFVDMSSITNHPKFKSDSYQAVW